MAYPVTLNGRTYTLADFEGNNYVDGLPDAFEDFVTHAGDVYNDTSTTSNSIGTGSKTFTVTAGKPYQAGTPLRIADAAAPATNFLDAVVTSYSGTTLVVEAIGYGGSGTKTSWTVNIGGAKTIDGTLGVSQGGTGATTAAAARTNLDTYSKTEADSRFLNVSGEASDVTMTGNVTIGDAAGDTLTVPATASFSGGISGDVAFDTDTVFIDATNNRLGIGTATVSDPLHIKSVDPAIRFEDSSSGITGHSRIFTDNNNALTFDADAGNQRGSSAAIFKVDGTEHLRLDEYGQLILQSNPSTFFLGGTSTGSLVKGTSTGNYLIFGTSGAEVARFVGNNFGIGTSSPAANLEITDTSDLPSVSLSSTGTDHMGLITGTVSSMMAATTGNNILFAHQPFADRGTFSNFTERMRISSDGSVGINTTTMQSTLNVQGNTGNIANFSFPAAAVELKVVCPTVNVIGLYTGADDNFIFGTNSTERMRLDASGNLLVGTTDNNPANDTSGTGGIALGQASYIAVGRANDPSLFANRIGTDGDVFSLFKNGSNVGSIAAWGGDLNIGTGDVRLKFTDSVPAFLPRKANDANSDNYADLGDVNNRFKDLYLSGGVYLGGTGAANKLDDYEEGTWAAVASATSATTMNTSNSTYTKIGRLVTCYTTVGFAGASGVLSVSGLPFTVNADAGLGWGREDATSGYGIYYRAQSGTTSGNGYYMGAVSNATAFQVASGNFRLMIIYYTDS